MHALLQHSTALISGPRSVEDNAATPVTAMMVTVCISTDAFSSEQSVGDNSLIQLLYDMI